MVLIYPNLAFIELSMTSFVCIHLQCKRTDPACPNNFLDAFFTIREKNIWNMWIDLQSFIILLIKALIILTIFGILRFYGPFLYFFRIKFIDFNKAFSKPMLSNQNCFHVQFFQLYNAMCVCVDIHFWNEK